MPETAAPEEIYIPPSQEITVNLALFKTQHSFVMSNVLTALLCGPRREGKSVGGMARAIRIAQESDEKYWPMRWLVVRDTWKNLSRTTMKTIQEWIPDAVASWKENNTVCIFPKDKPFIEFTFLGLEHTRDWNKLQSFECAGLWLEEPAPAADESSGLAAEVYGMGVSCLSQKGYPGSSQITMNPPDDQHWTYQTFWENPPEDTRVWNIVPGENKAVTDAFRQKMRKTFMSIGRPDLMQRLTEGKVVNVNMGEPVTPGFSDRLHLSDVPLEPIPNLPLYLLWDFGLNPTCIITQVTPLRRWNFLHTFVGENMGVEQLIQRDVLQTLNKRFQHYKIDHIGDPAGKTPEQSSSRRNAVRTVQTMIHGDWRDGPVPWDERRNACHRILNSNSGGYATVQIDLAQNTKLVRALRGGWKYYKDARSVVHKDSPVKDVHSHPGDSFASGAAVLFPLGYQLEKKRPTTIVRPPRYFPRMNRGGAIVRGGPGIRPGQLVGED